MKNLQRKKKPAKTSNGNLSAERADGLKPLKEMGGLPNVEQLSLIAATLARNTDDSPEALAARAMKIWLASRIQICVTDVKGEVEDQNRVWVWDKSQCSSEADNDFSLPKDSFQPTGEYPVNRDQFLQTMLPISKKNRTYDLAKIAKAFVRDTLREKNGKDPTESEISGAYGRWKNYENADEANAAAGCFRQWYPRYIKQLRSLSGKMSATIKANKKAKLKEEAAEKAAREAQGCGSI